MRYFYTIPVALLLLVSSFANAQSQSDSRLGYSGAGIYGAGMTLAKDYESIDVNPANLGLFDNSRTNVSLGILEVGGSIHSDAFTKTDLLHNLLNGSKLSPADKRNAAINFTENGTTIQTTVTPIALAIQIPKIGGFAFSWKEKVTSSITMNSFLANLTFLGFHDPYFDKLITNAQGDTLGVKNNPATAKTYSQLFDGSKVNFQWVREYNLNYGRELISNDDISLNAGVGVKYIQGFGILDATFQNGGLTGYDAASPVFDIKYGDINNPSSVSSTGLKPVGHGFGADLGVMIKIKKRLRIGASITDLGSVTWNGNVLTLKNTKLDSLKNFNGASSLGILQVIKQFNGSNGLLQWAGEVKEKIALPAQLHLGASYELDKWFEFAFDITNPLNHDPGNLDKTMYAGGVNFTPAKCLRISTGFVTGGLTGGFNIPLGVAASLGKKQFYQVGISTGDVLSFVRQNKPTVSATVAVLRFCF